MKKIIYTLIVLLGVSTFSMAQDMANIAVAESSTELAKSKVNGEYAITMPAATTNELVEASAKYYKDIFTVSFDASTKVATITMIENTEKGRYVIARFLSGCGVREVQVDEANLPIYNFIDEHLK